MEKSEMTVAEMIKLLSKYNKDDIVYVRGGEDDKGEWGVFGVVENGKTWWKDGKVLLES